MVARRSSKDCRCFGTLFVSNSVILRRPSVARASKDAAGNFLIQPMGAFVYMLRCSDDSYYVGNATGDDLTKRIAEHQAGVYRGYTFTRRPVQLIWSQHFERFTDANAAERQIKGWSRAKKEALAKGEWDLLKLLAKRRGARGGPG